VSLSLLASRSDRFSAALHAHVDSPFLSLLTIARPYIFRQHDSRARLLINFDPRRCLRYRAVDRKLDSHIVDLDDLHEIPNASETG